MILPIAPFSYYYYYYYDEQPSMKSNGKRMVSGDLFSLRFTLKLQEVNERRNRPLTDEDLFFMEEHIRDMVSSKVHQILGEEFEVTNLVIKRGSIEILVTIGALYTVIAQYRDFVESVRTLIAQLRQTFIDWFHSGPYGQHNIEAYVAFLPTPTLLESGLSSHHPHRVGIDTFLIWYFILSHAVLLGIVIFRFLTIR